MQGNLRSIISRNRACCTVGGAGRSSLGGTGTPLGGLGSYTPQQPGDLRAEVEALRALLGDLKKDMATEGGSIRREWQRAFSDMQSRYGEQVRLGTRVRATVAAAQRSLKRM